MFIVNPNKGGYQGDVVNSGFRKGQQDAYRDYIDNYNFAVSADAANNAENQLNVERAAKNYMVENQMRQGARIEAINFVNDTSKLDDAIVGNEMNRNKNDYLWANAEQLGKSMGVTFAADQSAKEGKARTDAAVQQDMANNPQFAIDANRANLEQPVLKNEQTKASIGQVRANTAYTETNTETARDANAARKAMADNTLKMNELNKQFQELNSKPDSEWQNQAIQNYVAYRKQNGDTRSEAEITEELQKNPQELTRLWQAEKADKLNAVRTQYDDLNAQNQALTISASGGRSNGRSTTNSSNNTAKRADGSVKFTAAKNNPDTDPATYLRGISGQALVDSDGRVVAKRVGNLVHTANGTYDFPPNMTEAQIMEYLGLNAQQGNSGNANASDNPMGN